EHAAESKDIRTPVDGHSSRLFWRHVGGRSHNHSGRGCCAHQRGRVREVCRSTFGFPHPGKTEVEHLNSTILRQLDIRRLEVTMNDPFLMGGFKSLTNLLCDR